MAGRRRQGMGNEGGGYEEDEESARKKGDARRRRKGMLRRGRRRKRQGGRRRWLGGGGRGRAERVPGDKFCEEEEDGDGQKWTRATTKVYQAERKGVLEENSTKMMLRSEAI
jgi:hypothetical protein